MNTLEKIDNLRNELYNLILKMEDLHQLASQLEQEIEEMNENQNRETRAYTSKINDILT